MKAVVIGTSPYQITSLGHVCSIILKHLYFNEVKVAAFVTGHDTQLYVPEEESGKKNYYYGFQQDSIKHKIPIIPYPKNDDEVKIIYELLQIFEPDLVITVGDFLDFMFMKAIKIYQPKSFKWLFVMMNNFEVFNTSELDLLDDIDGIIHTSSFSKTILNSNKGPDGSMLKICPVGYDENDFKKNDSSRTSDEFRIMVSGKNRQIDNIPMVMETVAKIRQDRRINNIKLFLHANIHEQGDYNLDLVRQRIDPNQEFIKYPEKFISLFEGLSVQELSNKLYESHLFVSVPMISSSSCSVYEAIFCGCMPLVIEGGSHEEAVYRCLGNNIDSLKERMIVRSWPLMNSGQGYLRICDPKELEEKILYFYNIFQEGKGPWTSNLVCKYTNTKFLQEFFELVKNIDENNSESKMLTLTVADNKE